jgi:uncharacterized membrane protein YobD (UPF0266 family)
MKNEKLTKLTTEQLQRRKKIGTVLFIILIVIGLLSISLGIYSYLVKENVNTALIISALACLSIAITFSIGVQGAKKEIARRKDIG